MKKIISMILICLFVIPTMVRASDVVVNSEIENTIPVDNNTSLASNAKSAILIEATTGKIIFEKNSHEKLAPASMTKIMSMLLIMENIDKGIIKWEDKVTASANASGMGGSQILLETGEVMTVYDLFKGIAVASGNELAVSIKQSHLLKEEIII